MLLCYTCITHLLTDNLVVTHVHQCIFIFILWFTCNALILINYLHYCDVFSSRIIHFFTNFCSTWIRKISTVAWFHLLHRVIHVVMQLLLYCCWATACTLYIYICNNKVIIIHAHTCMYAHTLSLWYGIQLNFSFQIT